ncbi:hypothetical protein TYRP_004706 [Tyrophagus putrescentiae]|nr:hypothetical protein TYRP_004706 [Tyrophagus putrescentiae]
MFKYGLLLLTYKSPHLTSVLSHVGSYLKTANSQVSKTLYISLESGQRFQASHPEISVPSTSELLHLVPRIYTEAHKYAPRLDVRVLHHANYHHSAAAASTVERQLKRKLQYSPEIIFTNEHINEDNISTFVHNQFDNLPQKISVVRLSSDKPAEDVSSLSSPTSAQIYDNICLGGTFDNLHNGHKIMLSTSQLKCQKALTIGVTDRNMVRHKTLWELIESPEDRISKLHAYLSDIDPYIEYKITPIQDPFGPAIVDGELQAIVVSEETIRGGHKINEIRASKSMSQLDVDVIHMLNDGHREHDIEEEKVSSSSLRIRKLGTLIKEPEPRPNLPTKPYIIGLTGMIASGKSSISEKLRKLGAGVVNRKFWMPNGNIDRRKLGAMVFEDEAKLTQLNSIIWPKVAQLVEEEVKVLSQKYSVIVLEIALLIEANWLHKVHQVWLSILDEKEAIERLKNRNNLREEEARKRVEAFVDIHEKGSTRQCHLLYAVG